ncbi:N-succinylarginine dihydrolase [uncultured Abyssibacter sp.]|uniref:N-succinylarginine dihydrolase n=1 Tax=uncultured Abyssibacter sp. TaxID=2320202 RepID=UPI0032B1D9F4
MLLEANFDGLVGPSHHFGGLGIGNLASQANKARVSNPLEAALQGLEKMAGLAALGLHQGVLPPQARPDVDFLRRVGFVGTDTKVLAQALSDAPGLLSAAGSAAAMWAANAATVSASADTWDSRVHFTPANLVSQTHRALETPTTAAALKATFPSDRYFAHHPALPACTQLADEGAANHTRFALDDHTCGVSLFVYGTDLESPATGRFPARQTRLASEAVARQHRLRTDRTLFAAQHPEAINAGVFHNDVIAVGHRDILLYHEMAFANEAGVVGSLSRMMGEPLRTIRINQSQVDLSAAITSYLFNSQIVTLPDGTVRLIVAKDCEEHPAVWAAITEMVESDGPIDGVQVFDVRQSMRNGGGPACLRLRVPLNDDERGAVNPDSWFTPDLHKTLKAWVEKHYRDRLAIADLADPAFLNEVRETLDRLTVILGLGSIYPFQQTA